MRDTITAIQAEYLRYKSLAEAALSQLEEPQLGAYAAGQNSVATICWHVAGNLRSRFTDFLTTDGEKPWRDREDEFAPRNVSRAELVEHWERGWAALLSALEGLSDSDLTTTVTIRAQPLTVREALFRSLAHAAYHVGQVVYVAHGLRGDGWKYLSIAPGKSADYNAAPSAEKPAAHAELLRSTTKS